MYNTLETIGYASLDFFSLRDYFPYPFIIEGGANYYTISNLTFPINTETNTQIMNKRM